MTAVLTIAGIVLFYCLIYLAHRLLKLLIIRRLKFRQPAYAFIGREEIPEDLLGALDKADPFMQEYGFAYSGSVRLGSILEACGKTSFCNTFFNPAAGVHATVFPVSSEKIILIFASCLSGDEILETVTKHDDIIFFRHRKSTVLNGWYPSYKETLRTHLEYLNSSGLTPVLDREQGSSILWGQYQSSVNDWTEQGFMKAKINYWQPTWKGAFLWLKKLQKTRKRPSEIPPFSGFGS
jgi:hypothetical protein